jgi:phospho-N-acetylmuramoyl-pentapeptide-transferase
MPLTNPIFMYAAAIVLAFLVTFITASPVISYLRGKKLGQQIREDGPQRHFAKAGTPTMGGMVILAGLTIGVIASWFFFPHYRWHSALLLALTLAVAGIGSVDDWGKIKRGRSLGLRARDKLLLQFLAAALFVGALVLGLHHGTAIGVPGVGEVDLRWAYWPVAVLFIAGMSNAVNLTDGLDGLAAGTTVAAAIALAAIAWRLHAGDKGSLIGTFSACLGAACLAFLWYNRHPAKVFMGDTGSLAIGAALAGVALMLRQEVLLLLIGLIFIMEMGSVIIQVISFKTTGKRVFRMSPFHHHLELGGWSEPKIVTCAWCLGVALAVLAIVVALPVGK